MKYVLRGGELVEKSEVTPPRKIHLISDIQPYKSMIDGHMVTSRSEHRTHLRDHNCIEVGNEKMESGPAPLNRDKRREAILRAIHKERL